MAGFHQVGTISRNASPQMHHTAFTGWRAEPSWRQVRWNGVAPSRENANSIREAEVTEAMPQNSCATTAMNSMNSAHLLDVAVCQMYCTMNPAPRSPPVATLAMSAGTAKVTASRMIQPKTSETTTDMITPRAAPREAFRVSSLMWAEAS